MSVLSPPRPPIIVEAMAIAHTWCAGHVIDEAPAYIHAVRVAATLCQHVPQASTALVAACVLHDGPEFAPTRAELEARILPLGAEVLRIVDALATEHAAIDSYLDDPDAAPHRLRQLVAHDPRTIQAMAADKIVAFSSLLRRASRSENPGRFFAERSALTDRHPYFALFVTQARTCLPGSMARTLTTVFDELRNAARSPQGPTGTTRHPRAPS